MRTWLCRRAPAAVAAALCCLASPLQAGPQQAAKDAARDASAWEAPPEAKGVQNPMRGDGRTVERGDKLFQRYCVACHGAQGTADGSLARKMGYKPANLSLEGMQKLTDGEIYWKISKGRTPMPAFETQLSSRERWDLVSFVRTLVKTVR
jgi:mono/diheme cytochrome c family protein